MQQAAQVDGDVVLVITGRVIQRLEQGEAIGPRGAEAEGEHIDCTGLGGQGVAYHAVHQRHPAGTQGWQAAGVARQAKAQRYIDAGLEDPGDAAAGHGGLAGHIADTAGNAIGQAVFIDGASHGGSGCGRPIVLEDHLRADFGGCGGGLAQDEATDVEVGVVIALGVQGGAVLDQYAVVVRGGGVFDLVAGLDASDGGHPAGKADGNARIIHRAVRVLDHLPGAVVDHQNTGDGHRRIVRIAVDEVRAAFNRGAEGTDFYHRTLAALQLHHIEIGGLRIKDRGVVDVGFDIRFVLIQVGNGHVLPGAGDEGKTNAFLFHDHLVVGAEGGRPACLAGVDGVTGVDVDARRLVGGVLAGGDDRRIADPQDTPVIDHRRVGCGEHQEQVLPGRRIGQAELQVLAGTDEHLVQQVEGIVRVARVRVLERLVFHGPELAARDRRPGFLDVAGEHDGAVRATGPAQDDVVIVRIGIEQDAGAIEGIQAAVQAIERRAQAVGELDIGNVRAGRRVEGEGIAAGVTHGTGVATQGGIRCGTRAKGGQAGGEGRGQGGQQNVIVVGVPRRGWRGRGVLQPAGFVQGNIDAGRYHERVAREG